MVVIDRDAAARFGVTAEQIDDALYSAFGQRLVSTILTQLNQYHVVMEVRPEYQREPCRAEGHLRTDDHGIAGALDTMAHLDRCRLRWRSTTRASFPRSRCRSILRPAWRWDRRSARSKASSGASPFRRLRSRVPGDRPGLPVLARNEGWLCLAAIVTVYIVLGVLYESYVHPLTILSTLPSAGMGAILALCSSAWISASSR